MASKPNLSKKRKDARMHSPPQTIRDARFAVGVLDRVVNAIRLAQDALIKSDGTRLPDPGRLDSYWCHRCGQYVFDDDVPF